MVYKGRHRISYEEEFGVTARDVLEELKQIQHEIKHPKKREKRYLLITQ